MRHWHCWLQHSPRTPRPRKPAPWPPEFSQTRWHLPEITLDHQQPIEQIHFTAPSSLWASLSGDSNTTVKWNLEALKIDSTLFPLRKSQTRSLAIDSACRSMVVERAGVTLLCNAQTLKPIRDLGPLPETLSPSAVIVFSADGLLLAHPAFAAKDDPSLVWHLRDATTGEIIRQSDPAGPHHPRPLAAFLDRRSLRVLHADGSLVEIPVSPTEEVRTTPPNEPIAMLEAQFAANGGSALILKNPGPHRPPELCIMNFGDPEDSSLEPASLLERFPWNQHPGIWTGLLSDPELARLKVEGSTASILTGHHAPIHSGSAITALAVSGDRVIVGEDSGLLTLYRTLPAPLENAAAPPPRTPDAEFPRRTRPPHRSSRRRPLR